MRLARNRGPAGRLAIKDGQLRGDLFGNGVDDSQLPDLAKRSVSSLVHLAGTALWHDDEAATGQILDRGAAAPGGRDQPDGWHIGVDVEHGDLAGAGEGVIDPACRRRPAR